MKTKELIKKVEDKDVYHFIWAIWWRMVVGYLAIYVGIGALALLVTAVFN